MPFGLRGSKQSNRSQQALNIIPNSGSKQSSQDDLQSNSSPANASTSAAGPHSSNASTTDIQAFLNERPKHFESPIYTVPQNNGSRSQLQHYPQANPPPLPQQYAIASDRRFEEERPTIRKAAQLVIEHKKTKSRGFFGLGSKSKPAEQQQQQQATSTTVSSLQPSAVNNNSALGRRISKRNKDQPTVRISSQQDTADQQQSLPSPREDTGDFDPYQIRDLEPHKPQNPVNNPSVRILPRDRIPPVDTNVSVQKTPQYHSDTPSSQTSIPSGLLQQQNRYNTSKHTDQPQANSPNPFTVRVQPPNSDAVSQLSEDTAVEPEYRSSPVRHTGQPADFDTKGASHLGELPPRVSSLEASQPSSPATAMPTGQPRQPDGKTNYQTDGREVPPNYKQKFTGHGQSLQAPAAGAQGSHRGGPPQRESFQNSGGERGRETPPPSGNQEDGHKELLQKYKKVKGLYFEKLAQVEQLQNAIANQRLSHSRTALDDNEYSNRFNRLDGAIHNLAFNIRKDWVTIPAWLRAFVNQDANEVRTKEMTAVGRACISRWLTDEIFHRTFHPGLEPELSASLKIIETNIRKNASTPNSQEESDSLTEKLIHWRLTTLDGLSNVLNSPEGNDFREQFTQMAVTNLTAALMSHLCDPPPAGLEGSAATIVEIAVGITANLPLESRDISVIYPLPGEPVRGLYMKIEQNIPGLENPGVDPEIESSSTSSGSKDNLTTEGQSEGVSKGGGTGGGGKGKEKSRNSMLAGLMGSKKSQSTTSIEPVGPQPAANKETGRDVVRFAGFVGVEVVGRSMLVKAPVWTIS